MISNRTHHHPDDVAPAVCHVPGEAPTRRRRRSGSWTTDFGRIWRGDFRRILVLGPSGSGKTHFSIRLGRVLNIEVIHLDAHFWRSGWIPTAEEEWRLVVGELLRRPAWVMDGTYENTLDQRIAAADAVIVIDRPRVACLWGVFKRCVLHRYRQRTDAPSGQPIERTFLKYVWQYKSVTQPLVSERIRQHGPNKTVIVLRHRYDMDVFLRHVGSSNSIEAHFRGEV